jgi:hypothetical protein
MCDLKLQRDYDKSVARIRLVKTENPSACGTVNVHTDRQTDRWHIKTRRNYGGCKLINSSKFGDRFYFSESHYLLIDTTYVRK